MIGTIVWVLGLICCIWCIKDVWSKKLDTVVKVLLTIALLAFSWIGLAVYYFLLRNRL
jgi:membrane protein DedA with SNARE-associated domain